MNPKPFASLNHFTVPVVRIQKLLIMVVSVDVLGMPYGPTHAFS
jgi:hypothetical protein